MPTRGNDRRGKRRNGTRDKRNERKDERKKSGCVTQLLSLSGRSGMLGFTEVLSEPFPQGTPLSDWLTRLIVTFNDSVPTLSTQCSAGQIKWGLLKVCKHLESNQPSVHAKSTQPAIDCSRLISGSCPYLYQPPPVKMKVRLFADRRRTQRQQVNSICLFMTSFCSMPTWHPTIQQLFSYTRQTGFHVLSLWTLHNQNRFVFMAAFIWSQSTNGYTSSLIVAWSL